MKKTIVLKSMRTEQGANEYLAKFKDKFPEGAVVVKGMLDGDVGYGDSCSASSVFPGGGQIVVYETFSDTIKHVSSDDVEALVKALLDKDLVEVMGSGVNVSGKMYDLLSDFSKRVFERGMKHKSISAGGALAQALEKQDVETPEEEEEVRKSVVDILVELVHKAMSQKEASNIDQGNKGISDSEALKETKNRIKDPKAPALPTTPGPAPEGDLSQEEASNHKGDTRTEAISESYPDSENDIENSGKLFKSLHAARQWENQHRNYEVRETTFDERLKYGRSYLFTAVEKPAKEQVGPYGNRIRRQ